MAHQCSICLKMFKCASKLQRHHLIHTGEKPFICSVCGRAFRQAIHLKRHLETHTGIPFTSSWGQFESDGRVEPAYTAYPTIQDDLGINYTPDVPLQPCVSSEVYELKQTGDYVVDLKAIEQPEFKLISPDGVISTDWECLSGKDLTQQILQEHQVSSSLVEDATSNIDDVLQCAVCLKFCSSPYQLQKHLLVHSRQKPFECAICKQTFSEMAHLKLHSQTHAQADLPQDVTEVRSSPAAEIFQCSTSKEKTKGSHQCPECPKSFCSPYKLRRHCLSHTGQRPYHCIECGKSFRQLAHLKTHQDTHKTVLSIQTPSCERMTAYPQGSRLKDGNADKCQLPDSELPSFSSSLSLNLQDHKPLDSHRLFNAGISSNTTFTQRSLQMELQQEISAPVSQNINEWNSEEGQIPVKIQFDEGDIKRRSIHEKPKPFHCLICGQTFCQAANFQKHLCKDPDQDEFANHGEDIENESSPSVEPHQKMTERHDSDHKTTLQTDEVNALDLNIIVKQEHSPSSNNEEHVPAPDGIEYTTECQLQPALDNTKAKHCELTRKNHQCVTCLKCFPSPYKLQRHTLIHTGQRPFGCRVCGKTFRQLAHLMLHNRTHSRPEHIKLKRANMNGHPSSQIGNESAFSGSGLQFDSPMQENVPEYLGSEEPLLTSTDLDGPSKSVLDQDRVINEKSLDSEKIVSRIKHQCSLCFKCFSCPSKLQRHHLIHTGQKPFRCTLCGKTFRQAIHLKVHLQTHNKWRPFRRAFQHKWGVNTSESNASRQQHQSTESFYQEQLPTEPQGDLPTSDCQEKEEKKSGPKSDTSEHDSGDLTMYFESGTRVKLEDCHSNNNGDLQSMGGSEGVTSIKQCQLQPTSNDSVNECRRVKRKIYQCVTCLKCFLTPYKLERHVLSHTGQRPFSCHVCGKKFRQLSHMKFHFCPLKQPRFSQQRENNENSDLFSLQQAEFHSVSSEATLESDLTPQRTFQHLEISLGQSTPSEKGLDQNNVLATERNTSHGKHQCLICLKYFSCPSKLQRHILIHTGQKPFRCVLCGKTFRQAIHLKVHQQTHNKWRAPKSTSRQDELVNTDIPYGSGKCLNRLSIDQGQCILGSIPESDVLTSDYSHQEKVEEKDPHLDHKIRAPEPRGVNTLAGKFDKDTIKESEDLCNSNVDLQSTSDEGKKSIQKYQLQLELLNNVNECQTLKSKTYNCVTCLKCFSTPSKLQRHIMSHTGQRPFSCYVCGKKFHQIAHMKFHIRTHNQPRITLQKENYENSDPFILHHVDYDVPAVDSDLSLQNTDQNLEEEKRLDTPFNQSSPSEREMDESNHLSSGRNKSHGKHQCLICIKCFSCPSKLQRHLLTHTGQKPFQCVLCGKTFRQAIHLKVHQQTHNKWRALKRASRQDVLDNTHTSNGNGHHLSWSSSFQGQCILTSAPQSDVITSDSSHQETVEDPDVDCKMNSVEPGPVNSLAVQFDQDTFAVPGDLHPSTDDSASMPHKTTVLTKQLLLVSKENVNACQELKKKTNQCVVCLKCFSSPSKLQRHILTHTGQRPFSCYVCGRKFRQLSHMKFHILTHNRPKITQQKNNFVNSVTFSLHKNLLDSVPSGTTLDSDLPLQQNTPEKGTDEPLKLSLNLAPSEAVLDHGTGFYHGRNHGNVKHQCLICSKCFTCPSKLKRHNLIHTGQRPYRCVLCGKTFRQAIHLKVHQQTHKWRAQKRVSRQDVLDNTHTSNGNGHHLSWSSSFQGQCILTSAPQSDVITSDSSHQETVEDPDVDCKINFPEPGPVNALAGQFDQDTFAVPEDLHPSTDDSASMPHETTVLTKQLLLVSKEPVNACEEVKKKTNQCVVCLKCFSSPSKLQRHILTHTGQRPFSCYVCGRKFRQLSHMKFHILTHNRPKITQQKNNFVNSVPFSLRKNLLDSVPSGTTQDSDTPLQQHTPEKGTDEPLKLSLNLAPSEAVLDRDSGFYNGRNHSNVKHQCLICSKCFTCPSKLKRHNLIHTGQRPYRCVLCGKTFRQAIHLKVHQQTHNKWRTFRRAAQKEEVHTSRSREQDKAQCIITSVPQTSSLLKAGLNQLSGKEVVYDDDDVCAGRVMLEEHENQIDAEINTDAFQDSQCFSASSQLKSSNLAHLHPTPFKCDICYRNFKQLSHLKAHHLIHLETHPEENPFPIKNVPCQKQMNYGLEQEDQKVNSAVNQPAYTCSTHPQNSTLETDVLSPNKSNAQDQTSQESSGTEGKNTPRGKEDSEWSTLSLNSSFQNARLQDCTSTLPTTQEDEQNWDRLAQADQEESDCVIIEINEAGLESPVTLWHANGNSKISHSIKKGYQCPVCSKCFPSSSQLQQHALVHTENKPSKCPFCFKEFMQQSLLNSHLRTHEDLRDSGHCNLSNARRPEEHDGQELAICDQSALFITAEPVVDSWHPAAPDYSSDNTNLVDKDMSSLTGSASMRTEKLTRTAYRCTVCLKSFETPYKLSRHFLIHTGMKPFKCSVCSKSFRQLCHLQSHQQTHKGNIFRDVQPMDNGQRFDHTEDYPPQNLASDGHFSTTQFLQEAKLRDSLHLPDCTSYPLKPSIHCNLTSNDSSDHSAENMASGSVGILHVIPDAELEISVKQRKRDHKCSECQKSFSSPSKLERHCLIHAEERPFKCSICDKAFRQAAHLKVHQRVHDKISEDRSSFSSEIIDSGYNRHNSSHSHEMKGIAETHINYGMSKDIREGQESQVAGVEVALESEHCEQYWCEPFDGLFNCEDCNESFVTERKLNLHRCFSKSKASCTQSSTQSSFYQCAICFKNFKSPYKLKRHYVIHTGERPFRCSVCKKTFTQSGHLKMHELCHK